VLLSLEYFIYSYDIRAGSNNGHASVVGFVPINLNKITTKTKIIKINLFKNENLFEIKVVLLILMREMIETIELKDILYILCELDERNMPVRNVSRICGLIHIGWKRIRRRGRRKEHT